MHKNEPIKAYCRMFSKDKQHEIVWDIAALLKGIENMDFDVEYKNVLRLSEQDGGICTNPEYAMATDITKPCIIIKLNIENISCYVLPTEIYKKYIIDFDSSIL